MKKAIGILHNPDNGFGPLTIYYNGPCQLITAEDEQHTEYTEYTPDNEADARAAARIFLGRLALGI